MSNYSNDVTDIPDLPCEGLIVKLMGESWRDLPAWEIDGAWGIAIVRSILGGAVKPVGSSPLRQIANHLMVSPDIIKSAFTRLNFNGMFMRNKIFKDKALKNGDMLAWYYYAGIASGATGNVVPFVHRKKKNVSV